MTTRALTSLRGKLVMFYADHRSAPGSRVGKVRRVEVDRRGELRSVTVQLTSGWPPKWNGPKLRLKPVNVTLRNHPTGVIVGRNIVPLAEWTRGKRGPRK